MTHSARLRTLSTAVTVTVVGATALAVPASGLATDAAPTNGSIPAVAASHRTATSPGLTLALVGDAPAPLTKGDALTIDVRVTNTTATAVSGRSLRVDVGRVALDTLSAQSRWSSGNQRLSNPITANVAIPDLAAGASTDVKVTVPADELDLGFAMTSLPLQVTVPGTSAAPLRSFVTWHAGTGTVASMKTSVVVPVTLPNDPKLLTASGPERFEAWNKAIGPGSPIERLLTSDPGVAVTWLIDPAVLDPAAAQDGTLPTAAEGDQKTATTTSPTSPSTSSSATGSSEAASSASPTSGGAPSGASSTASPSSSSSAPSSAASPSSGEGESSSTGSTSPAPTATTVEELAAALVAKLKERPANESVAFTPYGDPDLSALTADDRPAGSDAVLRRTLARELAPELSKISTNVVAAPTRPLSVGATRRLDEAWSAARGSKPIVFTPNVTLDGSDEVSVTSAARRSTGGVPMIGYTSALSAALSVDGAVSDTDAGLREQAASLAVYQQLPSAQRSLVVMADRRALISPERLSSVLDAMGAAPWTSLTALDLSAARDAGAVARLSTTAPSSTGVWPKPGTRAFDAGDLSTAAATAASLTKIAGAVKDGDDIVPAWTRNLDQAAGTRWRDHSEAVDALVSHAHTTVEGIPERVGVVPSRINFFSDSGTISVTVKNDLARDVEDVRLALTPRTYAVQFREQPKPATVRANGQTTFRVPMAAQAAGQVAVDANLTTTNGLRLGAHDAQESPLQINARPTGTWIFWVLGIVALLVFCYGLVRNRQKGTRRRDELAREIQL